MTNRNLLMDEALYHYMQSVSVRESEVLRALREETTALPRGHISISPEQGQLLALLVKLIAAKRTIDIGVFTGYSALVVAQALPEDGQLVACDIDEDITQLAINYWQKAGVFDKIDLKIAPAEITLQQLIDNGEKQSFDFALIDADKMAYPIYYELCLQLIKPGGLIAIDNTFLCGKVVNHPEKGSRAFVMDKLVRQIAEDERVTSAIVPMSDGMLLCSPVL